MSNPSFWYVRYGKGPRIRIKQPYGTPDFMAAYDLAIRGKPAPEAAPASHKANTVGWLADQYRQSKAWEKLSPATRRQRECILRLVVEAAGSDPARHITKGVIQEGIDRRTAAAGRHFLRTMRGMFEWGLANKHVDNDPTAGVKVERPQTDGHHVWTDDERAAYEARWPLGTRERVAYDVLGYTGLRRGDAVRVGRPHVRNGVIQIKTEKGGENGGEIVTIPILPPLVATLKAGPIGELTFIAGAKGRPMKKESFGTWFAEACKAAGVPGRAHGIRKSDATRAAENGATEWELDAMFGWRGGKTSAIYTRKANRKKLSMRAADKLLADETTNVIPANKMANDFE